MQSDTWGWLDARTIGCLVGSLLLLGAFVAHQRRTPAPALDLALFDNRNFRWVNAATFAFGIAFTAMFFGSYLLLTELWGYSTLRAGLGISPGPALVGILAPASVGWPDGSGSARSSSPAACSSRRAALWRYVAITETPRYLADYLPGMLLSGVGVALCFPQMASTTAQSLPSNRLGVGGGVNQAIRQLGGTLGVALTIAFLTTGGGVAAGPGGVRPGRGPDRGRRTAHQPPLPPAADPTGPDAGPATAGRTQRPRPRCCVPARRSNPTIAIADPTVAD